LANPYNWRVVIVRKVKKERITPWLLFVPDEPMKREIRIVVNDIIFTPAGIEIPVPYHVTDIVSYLSPIHDTVVPPMVCTITTPVITNNIGLSIVY
jgi:hypothetical protein